MRGLCGVSRRLREPPQTSGRAGMASKSNKQVERAMGTAQPDFNMISREEVEGTTVYDPNGNEIGKVDHLMIDKISGQFATLS
jgi:hypothetical protein